MPDGNVATTEVIKAIAASYFNTAQKIKDKEITDPQEAINATRDLNRTVLGSSPGKWPDLFATLGKEGSALYVAGKIKNIDDWAVVHDEIYRGLQLAGEK